jgi:hypothetical protein
MLEVEDCPGRRQRKQKRRLRTSPLKRPGLIITSKKAVNFMVGAAIPASCGIWFDPF